MTPIFDDFPYTNYHELNLDYILEKLAEARNAAALALVDHQKVTGMTYERTLDPGEVAFYVEPAICSISVPRDGVYQVEFCLNATADGIFRVSPAIDGSVQSWSITGPKRGEAQLNNTHGMTSSVVSSALLEIPGGTHTFTLFCLGTSGNTLGLSAIDLRIYGIGGDANV